jgi:segregation and condensation protein B
MTTGPLDGNRPPAAALPTESDAEERPAGEQPDPGMPADAHPVEEPAALEALAAPEQPAALEQAAPSGDELRGALEAVLLVVDEPVSTVALATAVGVPEPTVLAALHGLRDEYAADRRGFDVRDIGGGWRLYTRGEFAPFVERFMLEGQHARLTQAALETLAVVAYRQPVSRSRVSAVRGVNVDGVMRTLVTRGLVEEAGADEGTGAVLYRTTPYFLERLGLRDIAELPNLADFLPESTSIDELEEQLSSGGRDD